MIIMPYWYKYTYARNRTQEKGNLYAKDKVLFDKTRNIRLDDKSKLQELI